MFRILSLPVLLATLAVSQSTNSSEPSLTPVTIDLSPNATYSYSYSTVSYTATSTISVLAPTPTSSNGRDIPYPSVDGNISVEFTFPKAGDYFATDYLHAMGAVNLTRTDKVYYTGAYPNAWIAVWKWPSDQPKQPISISLCSATKCFQIVHGTGPGNSTVVDENPWLPTDKQKKRKEWKDWPKDTYYTNLKDDWTNPFPFPELPITPSDEQYFLKMTTAEHNGTVLAVSDYFPLNVTKTPSPNYPKIPTSGAIASHMPSAAALAALLVGAFLVV